MVASLDSQTGKDLAEQCLKVLEHMSTRDLSALLEAGALNAILAFIRNFGSVVHKDALKSAMTVVSRLCSKIEPADTNMNAIVESLTELLKHADGLVSGSSLKCFASLADRFSRKNADTCILTAFGLGEILIQRLISMPRMGRSLVPGISTDATQNSMAHGVLNLLQVLVRSSSSVCQDLCKCPEFFKAVEVCMGSDDRSILETVRFVDLLIVVLFEGRNHLPRSVPGLMGRHSLRRFDPLSGNDRPNRHVIESIRGKDYDALVDAVENGVDVNTMDDVGQSLLNWAAAFGTQEMVEFLCENGADPNKGQRSSSLHYAACFGRPGIAKVLLQHGADPTVKDEDGKTSLEKAKERNEDGHKEIVKLLTISESQEEKDKPRTSEAAKKIVASSKEKKGENPEKGCEIAENLLPLFTRTGIASLTASVRKSCASAVEKMLLFMPSASLNALVRQEQLLQDGLIISLVKFLSILLNNDGDSESTLLGLSLADTLMSKCRELVADSLYRTGVVDQITSLAADYKIQSDTHPSATGECGKITLTGATCYKFGDWFFLSSKEAVYVWSDAIILEFPQQEYMMPLIFANGKLSAITHFPASVDQNVDVDGIDEFGRWTDGTEFLDNFSNVTKKVKTGGKVQALTLMSSEHMRNGLWELTCEETKILKVADSSATLQIQLRSDSKDTVFHVGLDKSMTALSATSKIHGTDGHEVDLSVLSGDKIKTEGDKIGLKHVGKVAQEVQRKYFTESQPVTSGPVAQLLSVMSQLETAMEKQFREREKMRYGGKLFAEDIRNGIRELINTVGEGNRFSSYEIQSSGVVKVLIAVLGVHLEDQHSMDQRNHRIELWKSVFHQAETASRFSRPPSEILVKTLVSALEYTEKFSISSFDQNSISSGFQILTRPLNVKLESRGDSQQLLDRTGRKIRIEPLVTVRELEAYLWKKLFKNWYDYERSEMAFIKKVNSLGSHGRLPFPYVFDFDESGILYWIGTNAKTVKEWINPATFGLVVAFSSDGKTIPCGNVSDFLNRSALPSYIRTSESKDVWLGVDLGLWVEPTHYSLRHGRGSGAVRSWIFQASRDGISWVALKSHINDATLSGSGSTHTWRLDDGSEGTSYRYYRIQMTGENSEFENCLCISGFEVYGTVTGVCDDLGKGFRERLARLSRHDTQSSSDGFSESRSRVRRGRDWIWGTQDGDPPGFGTIVARHSDDWVDVLWDHGEGHTYRMGADGKFDLHILTVRDVGALSSLFPQFARSISSPLSATGYSFPISHANRMAIAAESSRNMRTTHSRTTSSTLSLPETSLGFSLSNLPAVNVTEQAAVSADELHRATDMMQTYIARAEPVSHLNSLASIVSGHRWRLGSDTVRDSPEPTSFSALSFPPEISRSPEMSEDTLAELADLRPFSQAAERRRPVRVSSRFDPRTASSNDQTASAGSLSSLNDVADHTSSVLNQLSFSVPNLSMPSFGPVTDDHLKAMGPTREGRAMSTNAADTSRSLLSSLLSADGSDGPLAAAQSFPTLTSQDRSSDGIRLALTASRTRALLRSMRSVSRDSSDLFRLMSHTRGETMDLQDALDLVSQDDDTQENEEGSGFVSLAEFAMRTLQGRADRDDDGTDDPSSEEEVVEHQRCRSNWNDDFILKRQFSSLIPNFDPRPGRSNISQTTELDLRLSGRGESQAVVDTKSNETPNVTMTFRLTCNGETFETTPSDPNDTVIGVLQKLQADSGGKLAGGRRTWENSIVLVYGEKGSKKSSELCTSNRGSPVPLAASDPAFCSDTLILLRILFDIASQPRKDCDSHMEPPPVGFSADHTAFISQKLTGKMMAQLNDVVAVASNTLPSWCDLLATEFPMFFPFENRRIYFTATAFGTERSIIWLQNQRELGSEATRLARLEGLLHDFRIGRQRHVRVRVSRQHILDWAMTVMMSQAGSKSVLEVEFENEEGTGLGPTLEFYALVAGELQRKDLGMWICDDDHIGNNTDALDLGAGSKPAGYYVRSTGGLFPAPYPAEHPALGNVKNLFRVLGLIVGKALMDNRLIDLPFSNAFLKLLCEHGRRSRSSSANDAIPLNNAESKECFAYGLQNEPARRTKRQQRRSKKSSMRATNHMDLPGWYENVLALDHLEEVDPHRGRFIRSLLALIRRKQMIEDDEMLGEDHKREKLKTLACELHTANGVEHVRLEDLGLTFEFSPSSRVFKYMSCDLISDGDTVPVTIDNVKYYVDLTLDFCLNSGIRAQMDAFKEGIEQVVPLDKLRLFKAEELQLIMCGDQAPSWTRNDILTFTEPKLGYTLESAAFLRFVNVMESLTKDERKAFVQFVTGCSSLPPGGLANLHPRLTIVRKVTKEVDEGFPSVNTCVHYLKLPEYSSEQILYQRLMAATKERGFHFN
ncbi:E3 ubiquitin-protein ligase HECTD1-like [Paramacrobiotus metropolitanus]|uniref:E3 ubiquitin-protein ligase HECTD1-like n=1 Tax=Paramacrobiotus metropolitanus TaxID=2943436 RepID=UPI002445C043|nr:E3 ubiquitin-protein ligase HECTD1-like [Paramacrobiotus metropolitanus]